MAFTRSAVRFRLAPPVSNPNPTGWGFFMSPPMRARHAPLAYVAGIGHETASGRVVGLPGHEDVQDVLSCLGLAQSAPDGFLPEEPGNPGQSAKMIGACFARGEQHEHEITPALIDGVEICWLDQSGEASNRPVQAVEPGMRYRHALTHAS